MFEVTGLVMLIEDGPVMLIEDGPVMLIEDGPEKFTGKVKLNFIK